MAFEIKRYIDRFEELTNLLTHPDVINDQDTFKKILKEHSRLEPLIHTHQKIEAADQQIGELKSLLAEESDAEMIAMAQSDLADLTQQKDSLEKEMQVLMLPKNPDDHANTILEIRAGTGGDEAGLFVADLATMYRNYSAQNKWQWEVLSASETGVGGFKEFIALISGENVYATMKFEIGNHRVQRIPVTETQGRIHTSAVTVAVLPEREESEVVINPQDLKIDTYRSQGAGGQHVNTTDSAVRITHLPTGIVVACQEERSQIKNRAKAMKHLHAKIAELQLEKMDEAEAAMRKNMVGSGDRSERIRTYNFPQGRITDHRIKMTVYDLEEIMRSGNLSAFSQALRQADIDAKLRAQMDNPVPVFH